MTNHEINLALYDAQKRYETDNINALVFKNIYTYDEIQTMRKALISGDKSKTHFLNNVIKTTISDLRSRNFLLI